MKKDKRVISEILSEPFYNNISDIHKKLEDYVESIRIETIGWTLSFCCVALDKGDDPRFIEVPKILKQCIKDLDYEIEL